MAIIRQVSRLTKKRRKESKCRGLRERITGIGIIPLGD